MITGGHGHRQVKGLPEVDVTSRYWRRRVAYVARAGVCAKIKRGIRRRERRRRRQQAQDPWTW